MNEKNNQTKIKVTVFSIAFTLGLNTAGVAPILGALNEVFKANGASAVQTLQTIPSFLIMIASIFVGWLVTKIAKKRLLLAGLLLIAIIGGSPFVFSSFSLIIISRLLVGFGFGLMSPLNMAIISEFFQGKDRASAVGLHVLGMAMGAMFANIVGGIIGKVEYNHYFLVYIIPMIPFIIVAAFLPDTGAVSVNDTQKLKLNRNVYELSITYFFYSMFIIAFMTNIGIHIAKNIHGSSTITGLVTAVNALFALIVGLSFSKITSLLKQNTLPFSIFIAGLGYATITVLPASMIGILITSAFCGIALSCFMAQSSLMISTSVSQSAITLAVGVFSVFGGVGSLISPIVLNSLAKYVFAADSTKTVFAICMIGMFILSIYNFGLIRVRQKENSRPSDTVA